MDLNFRHGFTQTQLDLPWAIIDGAWAAGSPELLGSLRQYGTSTLVDTHSHVRSRRRHRRTAVAPRR